MIYGDGMGPLGLGPSKGWTEGLGQQDLKGWVNSPSARWVSTRGLKALQSMMNSKLSQQRFRPCHENVVVKAVPLN